MWATVVPNGLLFPLLYKLMSEFGAAMPENVGVFELVMPSVLLAFVSGEISLSTGRLGLPATIVTE